MGRRRFTPELKLEAVKLVKERGVAVRQAAADLGLHRQIRPSPPRPQARHTPAHPAVFRQRLRPLKAGYPPLLLQVRLFMLECQYVLRIVAQPICNRSTSALAIGI